MFLLKKIRTENGMKRSELARALNMNQGTLANYENEIREASYECLLQFADFFDVSVDELLGREPQENLLAINSPLKREEKELLAIYQNLSEEKKRLAREFFRILSEA